MRANEEVKRYIENLIGKNGSCKGTYIQLVHSHCRATNFCGLHHLFTFMRSRSRVYAANTRAFPGQINEQDGIG